MANTTTTVKSYSEVAPKTERPDYKMRDVVGKKLVIADCSKKDTEYKGEPITFYNVILEDARRVGVNRIIFDKIEELKGRSALPVSAKVVQKESKKGRSYFDIE